MDAQGATHAGDALALYRRLTDAGIVVWLTGGWGIDALLGRQTRPHKDLDVIVLLEDVPRLQALLAGLGFGLHELWSENRWAPGGAGGEVPTAFVLQDPQGRQVDAHAIVLDGLGNGSPAWLDEEARIFRREDLAGEGVIAGCAVRCLSAEMQVACHRGYEMPPVQRQDMALLREKFGV